MFMIVGLTFSNSGGYSSCKYVLDFIVTKTVFESNFFNSPYVFKLKVCAYAYIIKEHLSGFCYYY